MLLTKLIHTLLHGRQANVLFISCLDKYQSSITEEEVKTKQNKALVLEVTTFLSYYS